MCDIFFYRGFIATHDSYSTVLVVDSLNNSKKALLSINHAVSFTLSSRVFGVSTDETVVCALPM